MTTVFILLWVVMYLMFILFARVVFVTTAEDEETGRVAFWLVTFGMAIPIVVMIIRHLEFMERAI